MTIEEDNAPAEEQTITPAVNPEESAQEITTESSDEKAAQTGDENTEAPENKSEGEDDNTPQKKTGKHPGWVQKRLNELTGEKNQARQQAEELRKQNESLLAELAARSVVTDPNNPDTKTVSTADIERIAQSRAEQIATQKLAETRYVESLDRVWNNGLKEFSDFGNSVDNLAGAFGEKFSNVLPTLTEALDAPHKVIHHLAENLDDAARILSLSPARQVAELTKLETTLAKPKPAKPISDAAKPISTIDAKGGKATPSLDSSKLSTSEWMRLRDKDLETKGKRKW